MRVALTGAMRCPTCAVENSPEKTRCECGVDLVAEQNKLASLSQATKPLDRGAWWGVLVGGYALGFIASVWALVVGAVAAAVVWLKFGTSHRRMVLQGLKVGGIAAFIGMITPLVLAFTLVGIAAATLKVAHWLSMPH